MADNSDSINPRDWLKIADEDFGFASSSFTDTNSYYAQICFFFQQSAEKYLKAYIIAKKLEFRKIHELSSLLKICQSNDPDFTTFSEDCDYLTEFYFEARYPVTLPASNITREMTEKAKLASQKIGDFVKEKLSLY